MAKRFFLYVVLFGCITLGVFAGGKAEEVSYRDELATMSWSRIVELAVEEGEVNWFVWYLQPQFRDISQDFEKKYGIKVTIPAGTSGANKVKAISEKNLETGNMDILAYGNDVITELGEAEIFYGPIDAIIPGMDTRKTAVGGIDSNGYALSYWGNQTGLAYDPNRISESELPQTLKVLAQYMQDNPKSFSFCSPAGGGSGTAFIRAAIYNLSPQEYGPELEEAKLAKWKTVWEWFNDNADNYVITASNADSLTRLNDGEFVITAAWEDHMANLQRQGAIGNHFKFYIPEFGMVGGGNFSSVLKNAPHPAAALLFLEWLTSSETQAKFSSIMGAAPQNTDSDDSFALIPASMREYSTFMMPRDYELELRIKFDAEVALK